jgi:hypothetical protein
MWLAIENGWNLALEPGFAALGCASANGRFGYCHHRFTK